VLWLWLLVIASLYYTDRQKKKGWEKERNGGIFTLRLTTLIINTCLVSGSMMTEATEAAKG